MRAALAVALVAVVGSLLAVAFSRQRDPLVAVSAESPVPSASQGSRRREPPRLTGRPARTPATCAERTAALSPWLKALAEEGEVASILIPASENGRYQSAPWPSARLARLDEPARRLPAAAVLVQEGPRLSFATTTASLTDQAGMDRLFERLDQSALSPFFGVGSLVGGFSTNLLVTLFVGADEPWSNVVGAIEQSVSHGVSDVYFVLDPGSRVVAPADEGAAHELLEQASAVGDAPVERARKAVRFWQKSFPRCRGVIEPYREGLGNLDPDTIGRFMAQLAGGLGSCGCEADDEASRMLAWVLHQRHLGAPTTGFSLAVTSASRQDKHRTPEPIRAPASAPWHEVAPRLLDLSRRQATAVTSAPVPHGPALLQAAN